MITVRYIEMKVGAIRRSTVVRPLRHPSATANVVAAPSGPHSKAVRNMTRAVSTQLPKNPSEQTRRTSQKDQAAAPGRDDDVVFRGGSLTLPKDTVVNVGARGAREVREQLDALQKENFALKLEIVMRRSRRRSCESVSRPSGFYPLGKKTCGLLGYLCKAVWRSSSAKIQQSQMAAYHLQQAQQTRTSARKETLMTAESAAPSSAI